MFAIIIVIFILDNSSICPVCNVAVIAITDKKELKSAVSFAPLPPKIRDERCRTCGEICKSVNKCKHCKRVSIVHRYLNINSLNNLYNFVFRK